MVEAGKIFRTAEIPEIDKYTVENEGISSAALMERAAEVFVGNLLKKFTVYRKFIVVAGIGNNGGDGFAIARLLKNDGADVCVFRIGDAAKMSADCALNYGWFQGCGGQIIEVTRQEDLAFTKGVLIIDAIFGSGLNRPVSGLAADAIQAINRSGNKVVAVDIPSGLMGEDNSANDMEAVVKAGYTFTFQFPKLAFMFPENYPYVGEWGILDIGLKREIIGTKPIRYYYLTGEFIAGLLLRPAKFAHKGSNGHGLLVAGSSVMLGAAVLAAQAALRSGAGLITCHIPSREKDVMYGVAPEALIESDQSELIFTGVDAGLEKYSAVAVGPGIGKAEATVEGLRKLLIDWRGVTVIDADGLNILSEHREMIGLLHEGCILTPHLKEFERLAGKSENHFDRLNKLSNFASRYKICIILKGAHTVVAAPTGECYFNMNGNPGMAKGGVGDVLTGVLLALVTSGMSPLHAALAGVFAHGLAGDITCGLNGMRGICAGDIAGNMGKAWRKLESGIQ